MKILLASIPATGHFNPIFVAARMLKEAGHETGIYTSVIFGDKIEKAEVRFFALPEDADQGWRDLVASILEKHKVTPSPEEMVKLWTSVFVNPMISQFRGLQAVLKEFPAEVVLDGKLFSSAKARSPTMIWASCWLRRSSLSVITITC